MDGFEMCTPPMPISVKYSKNASDLSLSARDVIKAKIRLVSVAPAPRVLVCVRKNTKVFKKGMLSLDFFGLGLDQVWTLHAKY